MASGHRIDLVGGDLMFGINGTLMKSKNGRSLNSLSMPMAKLALAFTIPWGRIQLVRNEICQSMCLMNSPFLEFMYGNLED